VATEVSCSPVNLNWNSENNPFEEIYAEQNQWEQSLLGSYDELESWSAELAQKQLELERQESDLRQAQLELAEELATFAEQSLLAENNPANDELTAAITKLSEAEAEIKSLREQLAIQVAQGEKEHQERQQHEEQYAALELELEYVRNRAGTLSDSLTSTKTELERERAEWEAERQELKRMLSTQQAQPSNHQQGKKTQESAVPTEKASKATQPAEDSKKEDALVVGSVLAQFERIRSERAIRRRKAEENK